ncbi:MAG: hypothetical protein E7Z92_07345 [Cyanobacteria bacterium SIG31]|nr:hypothetical protein [Cyanobacteria bacterium SIG31]
MAPGYSITGLGYPQFGLGQLGLGGYGPYSSAYSSYMPATMGTYGFSPYGMGGLGYFNPAFMAQMQQNIEASQLQHAGAMHNIMKDVEVSNYSRSDNALIEKIAQNGSVAGGISSLYQKVREGDQEGVMQEWDKLKEFIRTTYRDELDARADKVNIDATINEIIKRLYASTISAQEGRNVDLITDLRKYGEKHFENGFNAAFFGDGHSKATVDDTLNHCFGHRIDDKGSKETTRKIGSAVGEGAEWATWTAGGIAAGTGVATAGLGFARALTPKSAQGSIANAIRNASKGLIKNLPRIGIIGIAASALAFIGGSIWQLCKD